MYKIIMLFGYYPCNSIQALNMDCIDAPIPISYTDAPRNIQMYRGAQGAYRCVGVFRHTEGHPNGWGHPNIWGCTNV